MSMLAALLAVILPLSGCGASRETQVGAPSTQFAEDSGSAEQPDAEGSSQDSGSTKRASISKQYRTLKRALLPLVEDYGDKVAVTVVSVDGEDCIAINGDEKYVSASMIKLLILAEFIDEVDSGAISLDDAYTTKVSDIVAGTGVIQNDPVGTTYSYDDLARLMVASSDNVATNILIDAMGFDAINAKAQELGLEKTELDRKMMQLDSGIENYISANDAASILRGIARGELGSKKLCKKAKGYLLQQSDSEGLAQGLPAEVSFAHKTGSLDSKRHDGGIVYADSPYVVVVLSDIGADRANQLMGEISATVYQQLEE